jgi:hypothetical protein
VGARAGREDFADDVAGEDVGEGGGEEADVTGSLVVGVYFCWCWLVDLVWFGLEGFCGGLTAGDEDFDEELVLARLWDLTGTGS